MPAPGLAPDVPVGPALEDEVAGEEDFGISAPVAPLSGSAGFGAAEPGAVALGLTALMPADPGLAGDALGLAVLSEGLPGLAVPCPEAGGFHEPEPEDDGVALGGIALLPVGPGLAGAALAGLSEELLDEAV